MRDIRDITYALLPKRYRNRIEEQAGYARVQTYDKITATLILLYLPAALALVLFLQLPLWIGAITFAILSPGALLLPYFIFNVLADRRRKEIETVLPDALMLMSANIESGLTVDKAFLLAARDEFGPLADDVRQAAMRMFGGVPVEEALEELAESTNSELFEETLKLLIDGINAGGEVSGLLESSANDIRKSLHLREEIASSVKTYSLFIFIAAVFGAPILFSISVFLTETTTQLWANQGLQTADIPDTGSSLVSVTEPSISPAFFANFALVAIIISNFFAALVISEIKNGTATDGLKRAPIFVVIAVIVYFAARAAVSSALGGLF